MESRFSTVKTNWFAEYNPGWTWRCWTCSSTFDSVGNLRHDDSSKNSSLTIIYKNSVLSLWIKTHLHYNTIIWILVSKKNSKKLTNFATKIWRCYKPRIRLAPRHFIVVHCLPTSTRSWRSSTFLNIHKTLLSYIKVRIIILPTIIFSTFCNLHLCHNYVFCQLELGTSHH